MNTQNLCLELKTILNRHVVGLSIHLEDSGQFPNVQQSEVAFATKQLFNLSASYLMYNTGYIYLANTLRVFFANGEILIVGEDSSATHSDGFDFDFNQL